MNKVRTLAMVDYVRQRKYCSTAELGRNFAVSPATIQRDISEIVRSKLLRKVHGGVAVFEIAPDAIAQAGNSHFEDRVRINPEKKSSIAHQAESLVEAGDILFLDSSSTALYLARQLQKSSLPNLTIITNSVVIVQEFHLFPSQFVLISLGGTFNAHLNAFLGKATVETLRRYRISKAFVSAAGITTDGLFTYHESNAEFLKMVIEIAKETHALLDSSKFNKSALFAICVLADLASLISDAAPPQVIESALRRVYHLPTAVSH
jgi:DeoR/GlpR family transcriptional regulator of sugar metabolism